MIENKQATKAEQDKVFRYFTNPQIAKLLITQLNQLHFSEIGKNFTLSLAAENLHLFIYFHRSQPHDSASLQQWQQMHGCYAIKITKQFPLAGLRVHILSNSYTPRLFDCRDVTAEIIGHDWTYKNKLIDILTNVEKFQNKLSLRANQDLAMQKTGQFRIGDLFDVHELKKFSSLILHNDISKEDGPVLGTTETHFLTFKIIPQKESNHKKIYQLVRACDLQCIHEIFHNKKNGEVILMFCKYKVIKSFNEHEKISRKYKLEDSQQLVRNILKNIVRFQKVDINLQLGSSWDNDPACEKINKKLWEIQEAEQALDGSLKPKEKKDLNLHLLSLYHKIIEYFSERTNCYYLIFVGKLNKMQEKGENSEIGKIS